MKFRLSTGLLLVVTFAVALGWYVDRQMHDHRALTGEWCYPTNDVGVLGYTSLLNLRSDGTFTKIQGYRTSYETFDGTYELRDDGRIRFHVTSRTEGKEMFELMAAKMDGFDYEPTVTKLDEQYDFRCAVDSAGYLVIDARTPFSGIPFPGTAGSGAAGSGIEWETHARDTNSVIYGRR